MDRLERSVYSDIHNHFLCCPFCGNTQLNINLISLRHMGKDTMDCLDCGARWHLYLGLYGFAGAKLERKSKNGRGIEFLGKRHTKDYWMNMIQSVKSTTINPFQKFNV